MTGCYLGCCFSYYLAISTHFWFIEGRFIGVDLLEAFLTIFLALDPNILFVCFFTSPSTCTKTNGNYSFLFFVVSDLFLLTGEQLDWAVPLCITRHVPSAFALFRVYKINSFIALLFDFLPTFNFFSTYQNSCGFANEDSSSCFQVLTTLDLAGYFYSILSFFFSPTTTLGSSLFFCFFTRGNGGQIATIFIASDLQLFLEV